VHKYAGTAVIKAAFGTSVRVAVIGLWIARLTAATWAVPPYLHFQSLCSPTILERSDSSGRQGRRLGLLSSQRSLLCVFNPPQGFDKHSIRWGQISLPRLKTAKDKSPCCLKSVFHHRTISGSSASHKYASSWLVGADVALERTAERPG
jgi:hypothetical protein